jgi:hypothetical protein
MRHVPPQDTAPRSCVQPATYRYALISLALEAGRSMSRKLAIEAKIDASARQKRQP